MATQSAEMNKLQEQIDQSEETVASAQQQIEDAQNQTSSYENLIKAYAAFQSGNYTSAANVLQNVQADLLSVDAKEIYDSIYKSQFSGIFVVSYHNITVNYFPQAKSRGILVFMGYPLSFAALSSSPKGAPLGIANRSIYRRYSRDAAHRKIF